MLVLIPFFLLIIAALGILILQRVRPGIGYTWLIAVGVSLICWLYVLVLYWTHPAPFVFNGWLPLMGQTAQLVFELDNAAWQYALGLLSLLLAVMLTSPVRFRLDANPRFWIGSLVLTAGAFLAVMANNPLTLVLVWSGNDLIEVTMTVVSAAGQKNSERAIAVFATRVAGTLIVVWMMSISNARGMLLDFGSLSVEMGLYLLLAASLRLGVVPFFLSYSTQEQSMRRGLGTILRLSAPASSLVVLGRLPNLVMPPQWALFLLAFTALAVLYGAGMWATARDELDGRPYWIIAFAGMAVASVVRGRSDASLSWGVALVFSGSLLFLYSVRHSRLLFLPLLGMLGFVGFPFSPAAGGWRGMVVLPFNLFDILLLVAHSLLLLGYLRHALRSADLLTEQEGWVQVVYPAGLLLLVLSHWVVSLSNGDLTFVGRAWWTSLISVMLALAGLYVILRISTAQNKPDVRLNWIVVLGRRTGRWMAIFFSLEWFYWFLGRLYRRIQELVQFLTTILDGDGGILWSLLLTTLVLAMIRSWGK